MPLPGAVARHREAGRLGPELVRERASLTATDGVRDTPPSGHGSWPPHDLVRICPSNVRTGGSAPCAACPPASGDRAGTEPVQTETVPSAVWQGAAAVVALTHLAVILFLVGGGFLVRRRRGLLWAQVAVVSGVVGIALAHAPCPLTELELWLRRLGGAGTYRGGFIEHYLVRPVYPAGITPRVEVLMYAVVITTNVLAYAHLRSGSGRASLRTGEGKTAVTRH
jgi:hypothetical protein